jgi:hypothetical protein
MCEDYRAGLGIDRAHDDADRREGRLVQCPALVIWATRGDMEELYGDPVSVGGTGSLISAEASRSTADTTWQKKPRMSLPKPSVFSSQTRKRVIPEA